MHIILFYIIYNINIIYSTSKFISQLIIIPIHFKFHHTLFLNRKFLLTTNQKNTNKQTIYDKKIHTNNTYHISISYHITHVMTIKNVILIQMKSCFNSFIKEKCCSIYRKGTYYSCPQSTEEYFHTILCIQTTSHLSNG